MLKYIEGNIFDSTCQTIVNPVNCIGVMGGGLAYQFKVRFPEMNKTYVAACKSNLLRPGMLSLHKESTSRWILNFPTKDHYKDPSLMSYVENGLLKFVDTYEARGITSIAFPGLGAGLGGLDRDDVHVLFEKYLSNLPIKVEIYVA